MKLRTYITKKYGTFRPITRAEARIFGVPYPLSKDWMAIYGDLKLSDLTVHRLFRLASKKKGKQQAIANVLMDEGFTPSPKLPVKRYKPVLKRPVRKNDPASEEFLKTYEWRRVRMEVLKKYGARCQCCGASSKDGVVIHVDHIKPRRLFPELALDIANLQVLCEVCNHGKGNWDATDWRETS